jgi:hypothetical protein
MTPDQTAEYAHDQIRELWELVEELGDLSMRLSRAADAAMEALQRGSTPPSEEGRT